MEFCLFVNWCARVAFIFRFSEYDDDMKVHIDLWENGVGIVCSYGPSFLYLCSQQRIQYPASFSFTRTPFSAASAANWRGGALLFCQPAIHCVRLQCDIVCVCVCVYWIHVNCEMCIVQQIQRCREVTVCTEHYARQKPENNKTK